MASTVAAELVERMGRDIRDALASLTPAEARYLVDAYYEIQDHRKAAGNQVRALSTNGEPHAAIGWLFDQTEMLENEIKRALDWWTDGQDVGRWAKSIIGIGPVISAGLLAHIEIEKAPTVGHIWRFAGLDPTVGWAKGEKRPWNADLKVLCWKVGESFVKQSNHPKDVYGKVYQARKALETERNDSGAFAAQAEAALVGRRFGKDTDAYAAYSHGKLPPAHIHARAKRYAVKLFLAHYHHVAYEVRYGVPPPKPYVLEHLGHATFIAPPNWPM